MFTSYDFFVIALPLGVLAFSTALVGGILLYKKQSLLGDALGHGTYPGVILAYMLFATKSPKILALGASFTAFCTLRIIQSLTKGKQGMRGESALALSLSGMFGLGMVLKTVITGNPHFSKASQSGLKSFLFGSAAFLQKEDFLLILCWSLFSLGIFFLFKRSFRLYCFDPEYGEFLGMEERKMHILLCFLLIPLLALGIKILGVLLMASFLVLPMLFARELSERREVIFLLSGSISLFYSLLGTGLSLSYQGFSTGAGIIVLMGGSLAVLLFLKQVLIRIKAGAIKTRSKNNQEISKAIKVKPKNNQSIA